MSEGAEVDRGVGWKCREGETERRVFKNSVRVLSTGTAQEEECVDGERCASNHLARTGKPLTQASETFRERETIANLEAPGGSKNAVDVVSDPKLGEAQQNSTRHNKNIPSNK
jgi:hypothetical protein